MKRPLLYTLGLIVLSMVAFATSSAEGQTPVDQTTIVRNKLEERIKADINKVEPRIKLPHQGRNQYTSKYTYYGEITGEYSMDIKRTDSIISPYIGIVNYDIRWYANSRMVAVQTIKAVYAYQDDQWVLTSAIRYTSNGSPNNDHDDVSWVKSLFQ